MKLSFLLCENWRENSEYETFSVIFKPLLQQCHSTHILQQENFVEKERRKRPGSLAVLPVLPIIRIAIGLTVVVGGVAAMAVVAKNVRLNFCVDMVKWPLEKSGRLLSGNYHQQQPTAKRKSTLYCTLLLMCQQSTIQRCQEEKCQCYYFMHCFQWKAIT